MRFGPTPLDQAEGAVLAHSVALPDGRLAKGKRLTRADLQALEAAGMTEVTVARLDPGDVDENTAAAALAKAILANGTGLRATPATTGRVNLIAEGPGLAHIDADAVHRINAVDPMITLATVPEWQRMGAGGMVATVKVIAYAVGHAALEQACAAAPGALSLRAPTMTRAALIQSVVGQQAGAAKGAAALATRLGRLGVALSTETPVPHAMPTLAQSLRAALVQHDPEILFILTGSATSDGRDVAPEALRAAGGAVTHFGMPVDPGNLLFLGQLEGRPVVGLPGCARSPALNGADWVLERLICGLEVGPAQIAAMGVGGLLKDIPQRGRMRDA